MLGCDEWRRDPITTILFAGIAGTKSNQKKCYYEVRLIYQKQSHDKQPWHMQAQELNRLHSYTGGGFEANCKILYLVN